MTVRSYLSEQWSRFREIKFRNLAMQVASLGLLLSGALIMYKSCMLITNSESPIVVVLSGSMEPAIHRGDLLLLSNRYSTPLVSGDIVVYKLPGRDVPIVHRIIKVHQEYGTTAVDILTKGDNNLPDDRELYGDRKWLSREMVVGRAFAFLPRAGMLTILMNEYPKLKYALLGGLSLLALVAGD
ncbi:hypothetical protein MMPV_001420 [Pyropia vietnamensis]